MCFKEDIQRNGDTMRTRGIRFLLMLSVLLSLQPAYGSNLGPPRASVDLLHRILDSIPLNKSERTEYTQFMVFLDQRPGLVKARTTSLQFFGGGPPDMPIESIFDCIGAILTSAPMSEVDAAGPSGLSVNIANKNSDAISEIRSLNFAIREDFFNTHPKLDGAAFLFCSIPVDALQRYPGVMSAEEHGFGVFII